MGTVAGEEARRAAAAAYGPTLEEAWDQRALREQILFGGIRNNTAAPAPTPGQPRTRTSPRFRGAAAAAEMRRIEDLLLRLQEQGGSASMLVSRSHGHTS